MTKRLSESKWLDLINAFINQRADLRRIQRVRKLQQMRKKGVKPKNFKKAFNEMKNKAVVQGGDKENSFNHSNSNPEMNQKQPEKQNYGEQGIYHSFGEQKQRRNYRSKCHIIKEQEL